MFDIVTLEERNSFLSFRLRFCPKICHYFVETSILSFRHEKEDENGRQQRKWHADEEDIFIYGSLLNKKKYLKM